MKKNKLRNEFLDQLRKIPIILVACEKSGLSRNTVYRWRKEDESFAKEMDEALKEGEELVNDMGESQLLTLIKEKSWSATSFWLRHRNPKFKERVEITTKIDNGPLSPEQELVVRGALELGTVNNLISPNRNDHESKKIDPARTGGDNAERQKS